MKINDKIYFQNAAGETYGIRTKKGIELKNGDIIPPECIEKFINYVSRNGKKVRFE
jgi:hypothetical protein